MDTASATTEATTKLIIQENLEKGIGMHLVKLWLSRAIGKWDEMKYVVRWCDLKLEHFKWSFTDDAVEYKIMPMVADRIAEAYGVPLWSRGRLPKEHYLTEYAMKEEHFDLVTRYMSAARVAEVRSTMDSSYNNTSIVQKNPLFRTDIDKLEPVAHTINLPESIMAEIMGGSQSVLQHNDL